MTPQIEASQEALDALRSELLDLEALTEPTDEQVARAEALLTEWDTAKEAHDALVARAQKVEAIKRSAANPANVEMGFGAGVHVNVKKDPFEGLDALRFVDPSSEDTIARAVTAISETPFRGVSDEAREAAVKAVESVRGAAVHALVHGSPAYQSAFGEWLRSGGLPAYSQDQAEAVRTANSLTGANGGYTLPTLLDPSIIKTGTATKNPIRRIARVETGTQNVWHGVSSAGVTGYWKAEGSAFTEGSPTFSNPSVTAALLSAYVVGSYEIFEDSNLQGQLPGLISEQFDLLEAAAFISGSGSGAPKGIVTAISATAGSTVTATTRGSFTSASIADVYAVLNAVPVRFEDSSTWVANKATFNTVRQMGTQYGALFWADLNAGPQGNLLGSPVVSAQDMASATTSGTVLAILGDWSRYLVYDRIGTSVEFVQNVVDGSGLPTGQRGLLAHKRVGADCLDTNAFRFLKT